MNIYPNGKKIIYHNGWWHGNNTVFIRLIQDSATIIVLGNKYNRAIYDAKKLANSFTPYFTIDEEEKPDNLNEADSSGIKQQDSTGSKRVSLKHHKKKYL